MRLVSLFYPPCYLQGGTKGGWTNLPPGIRGEFKGGPILECGSLLPHPASFRSCLSASGGMRDPVFFPSVPEGKLKKGGNRTTGILPVAGHGLEAHDTSAFPPYYCRGEKKGGYI